MEDGVLLSQDGEYAAAAEQVDDDDRSDFGFLSKDDFV